MVEGAGEHSLKFWRPHEDSALAYAVATTVAIAAVLLRLALAPYLTGVQFITFFPAVVLAAYLCGQRPAIVTALLCGIAGWYLFVTPLHSFRIERPAEAMSLGVYLATALAIAALVGRSQAAFRRERNSKEVLRGSEARLTFLDRLGAETAPLADADAVLATTTRLVGEHLNLSICAYADMDEDQDGFTIRGDWAAQGSESIVGHYRLADFGKLAVTNLSAGLPLVVNDNLRELAPEEAATFRSIGIAATICIPLVKGGRLQALMAIHDRVPRIWTDTELSLLREVTERSWAHVERVGATAELRASERRLRAVFEQAAAGFARTDLSGQFVQVNDRYCSIVGRSREELMTLRMQDITHPDDLKGNVSLFDELVSSGPSFEIEKRYLKPNGSIIWVRNSISAVYSADGRVEGTLAVSIDLTQKRLAEARLRESEARFRGVFDSKLMGFTIFDANSGETLAINDAFLEMTGHSRADFDEGRWNWRVFTVDSDLALDEAAIAQAQERGWWDTYEKEYLRRDGTRFPVRLSSAPLAGEPGRVVVGVQDITEERAARLGLIESEARLRAVIGAAPVGLVFADGSGRITGSNARLAEIIGRQLVHSDSIDRYQDDYVAYHANGRQVEGDEYPLAKVVRGETERAELEVQVQLPEGGLKWVRYIAAPMRDEGNRMIGAVVASLDIDREKQFTERLAREVKAAITELESTQAQLRQSQKLEAMGQLTGGVAHDFNNLLTPIVGSLDMLQRKGLGGEREQRLIDGALQSAERAKTLVQRLLAFARRQPLQPVAVDLKTLVEGIADLVASTSGPRVKVDLNVAAETPAVKADANQLEMAILNLAVNARDAMPDGGRLAISARPEAVSPGHYAHLAPNLYVRLSVSDSGVGMDEATVARAVEPFFSTKGVGKGTGLGLSMVHGLAAQLGGALTIQSKPGLGTNVELWLPVSREAAGTTDQPVVNDAPPVAGTVLVVDDEDLVRMSTADMLADLGYAVVEARSAEEALRLVESGLDFNLLVTDHLMAGMTGTELAREVRARLPGTPVLIISGYAEVEGIAPDLPRLTKPFRRDDLAQLLSMLASAHEH